MTSTEPRPDVSGLTAGDLAVPGWQHRLVDDVFAAAGAKRNVTCLQVAMGFELRALLRAAADARGMGTSAYVRRAMCAFVAADLDLQLADVCAMAPPVRTDRRHGRRGKPAGTHGRRRDDGSGYGHWHACEGCDE